MSKIIFEPCKAIDPESGYAVNAGSDLAATFRFYKVYAGSILHWLDEQYDYRLFFYSCETEDRLIYTYCYQDEENWSAYCPEKSVHEWRNKSYTACEDGYIRVMVRKDNGNAYIEPTELDGICELEVEDREYVMPDYFQDECKRVSDKVNSYSGNDNLKILLLSDSHYVVNGTWEDTAHNIDRVMQNTNIDMLVHLGDLTDGMTPLSVTKEYSLKIMDCLGGFGKPFYVCLGNHDSNYFKGNPELITEEECAEFYLKNNKAYYYVDNDEYKLRMYFLYSFDQTQEIRYGFPKEEVDWLSDTLPGTPSGYKIIVFSHVPPLPQIHFWSDAIRNGDELIAVLEDYHTSHNNCVMAYVHGHNHADQVYTGKMFPIIGVGCNKLEDFKDKKPDGSFTPDRKRNTVSQDLWDVMIVSAKENKIDFIRFGAGENRYV